MEHTRDLITRPHLITLFFIISQPIQTLTTTRENKELFNHIKISTIGITTIPDMVGHESIIAGGTEKSSM
jgi:hypothetical protein